MSDPTSVEEYLAQENARRGRGPEDEAEDEGDGDGDSDGPATEATPTGGVRVRRDG